MTVCIAAVCEGGKKIVVAADRMFTAPPPLNLEFETSEKKIEVLAPSCVTLFAGNSAFATEIIRGARRKLAGAQSPAYAVAGKVQESYLEVRFAKVREQIILPNLGPDFLKAESLGISMPTYLQPQAGLYQQLAAVMANFNIQSDIIAAGIDSEGARLAVISHPGTTAWLDKLGYAAIGSGGIHAIMRLALGAQTSQNSAAETLYRVYEAKKASEVAPGVGTATDITIVDGAHAVECSVEMLTALSSIFNDSGGRTPTSLGAIIELMR